MPNNFVSVGHTNTGNVSGRDLLINYSLPCKNGNGMLSHADYQRFPYCNQCISSFRDQTYFRYQKYAFGICWIISALLIGGFYFPKRQCLILTKARLTCIFRTVMSNQR